MCVNYWWINQYDGQIPRLRPRSCFCRNGGFARDDSGSEIASVEMTPNEIAGVPYRHGDFSTPCAAVEITKVAAFRGGFLRKSLKLGRDCGIEGLGFDWRY